MVNSENRLSSSSSGRSGNFQLLKAFGSDSSNLPQTITSTKQKEAVNRGRSKDSANISCKNSKNGSTAAEQLSTTENCSSKGIIRVYSMSCSPNKALLPSQIRESQRSTKLDTNACASGTRIHLQSRNNEEEVLGEVNPSCQLLSKSARTNHHIVKGASRP